VVDELGVGSRVPATEEFALVVGDDGLLIVLLDGIVATVEEVVPVVGDHIGSDSRGLASNGDVPECLPRGVSLGPPRIELVE
jgi:hypothetical protein